MGRYMPGSQNHRLMAEKHELAVQLLSRGLTVAQVATQLRCSRVFVRKIRDSGASVAL